MTVRHIESSNPKVSIIILHLNNIPCLVDCISSLNEISYSNYDIYVVHNGAKSNILPDALAQRSQHIAEIIDTGANIGFSAGNNLGIQLALVKGADYVLLLNDDTEVGKDFLSTLVEIAEMRQDAAMFGPRIFFFDHPDRIWFDGATFNPDKSSLTFFRPGEKNDETQESVIESDYITGCALLIKRQSIEYIGLLDERFFLYWEDVDWGLRAKKAGLKNVVVPQSHIWHKVSASMGGIDSAMRIYHKTRSHLLLARLHAPESLKKLHMHFFRDIAWLLSKSSDSKRVIKIKAYIAAIIDYHLGITGSGPEWLWESDNRLNIPPKLPAIKDMKRP